MNFEQHLQETHACAIARRWVKNKTLEEAWETCKIPSWLVWGTLRYSQVKGWPTTKESLTTILKCIYEAFNHYCKKDRAKVFHEAKEVFQTFIDDKDVSKLIPIEPKLWKIVNVRQIQPFPFFSIHELYYATIEFYNTTELTGYASFKFWVDEISGAVGNYVDESFNNEILKIIKQDLKSGKLPEEDFYKEERSKIFIPGELR